MFNQEEKLLVDQTESLEVQSENKVEAVATGYFSDKFFRRLLKQLVVVVVCMMILSMITQSQHPWLRWTRAKIHSAINASSKNTFEVVYNWVPVKKVLQSCSNLVRLKEVTEEAASPAYRERGVELFRNAVWPVEGSVVRGYGWQNNPNTHVREFFSGIEIGGKPDAEVLALAGGQVTRISHTNEGSWQVVIDHGLGWVSTYQNLNQVKVSLGQQVVAGMVLATLKGKRLFLEIRYYERPIDPLAMLVS